MKQSISELASLTGMDRRRITSALADLPHDDGPKGAKLYESTDALPVLYSGAAFDDKKERARLTHHQANLASLQEQEQKGELVRTEDVYQVIGDHIGACRAKLLSMPAKLTPILVGQESPDEITATIESAIWEALAELANQYDRPTEDSGGVEATATTQG